MSYAATSLNDREALASNLKAVSDRIVQSGEGELLSKADVQNLLELSGQAVEERRVEGRLLAFRTESDWVYPALQFSPGGIDALIQDVLLAHRQDNPWVVLDVLLAPDAAYGGRSLLDLIRQGDTEAVNRYLAQRDRDGFG
ncbi:hypothetical protein [Roseovarius nanhaiticus]|uniref:hypothetical protein n=1 Tax=Roseovarius nanhaiticus TaxID=573024 RepID=UPI00248F7EC9|nr:hypothetical protein [Roseovarius nanhaiticus]